jgi:hypothetical protein
MRRKGRQSKGERQPTLGGNSESTNSTEEEEEDEEEVVVVVRDFCSLANSSSVLVALHIFTPQSQ